MKQKSTYGKLVGLTGGIASGKSTVSHLLHAKGAHIIDADQIAREVVAVGQNAWHEIKQKWGESVLQDDQQLDRKKLAEIIFNDPQARQALQAITHPHIAQLSAQKIQHALQTLEQEQHKNLVVYDAALLIESGRVEHFRPLLLVACSLSTQIQRLTQRDDITVEQAQQRLDAQMSLQDKIPYADYLIHNDHDLNALSQQIDQVWHTILSTY